MKQTIQRAGIVCCSNGQKQENEQMILRLLHTLEELKITTVCSDYLFRRQKDDARSGTAKERANALMDYYRDDIMDAIFDISGGDIAIELLPYLDFDVIEKSNAMFWGYSDLTTIINAIYTKTKKPSCLYQIRNLVRSHQQIQQRLLEDYLHNGDDSIFHFSYEFLRGEQMEGIMIGGNIRCLLKLAGSPYWPDMRGKILFLEGLSGNIPQLISLFNQLKLIGVWEQINGVLLGTFTEMEKKKYKPTASEILMELTADKLPLAVTNEIGHGADAKCLSIGEYYTLQKE